MYPVVAEVNATPVLCVAKEGRDIGCDGPPTKVNATGLFFAASCAHNRADLRGNDMPNLRVRNRARCNEHSAHR